MDSPVLFEVGSELGESYVAATELAGEGGTHGSLKSCQVEQSDE